MSGHHWESFIPNHNAIQGRCKAPGAVIRSLLQWCPIHAHIGNPPGSYSPLCHDDSVIMMGNDREAMVCLRLRETDLRPGDTKI